jgi:hypothetical protein
MKWTQNCVGERIGRVDRSQWPRGLRLGLGRLDTEIVGSNSA